MWIKKCGYYALPPDAPHWAQQAKEQARGGGGRAVLCKGCASAFESPSQWLSRARFRQGRAPSSWALHAERSNATLWNKQRNPMGSCAPASPYNPPAPLVFGWPTLGKLGGLPNTPAYPGCFAATEKTLSFMKTHRLSRKHIVFPEGPAKTVDYRAEVTA